MFQKSHHKSQIINTNKLHFDNEEVQNLTLKTNKQLEYFNLPQILWCRASFKRLNIICCRVLDSGKCEFLLKHVCLEPGFPSCKKDASVRALLQLNHHRGINIQARSCLYARTWVRTHHFLLGLCPTPDWDLNYDPLSYFAYTSFPGWLRHVRSCNLQNISIYHHKFQGTLTHVYS